MMNIERLARKLEPLRPSEVAQWRRTRGSADMELRGLMDRQLFALAYKTLGNIEDRPLLSLPPDKKIKGPLQLGKVIYDREYGLAGLTHNELMQNLAIFGRSGAGKTNVAFHILEQLTERKIPFLFLDWKRTARHLLPRMGKKVHLYTPGRRLAPFPFNPFLVPPGLEPNIYINHTIDLLADAYTLGDAAKSVLQKALVACYAKGLTAPMPDDILSEIERIPDKERVKGWKITVTRALESLKFAQLTGSDGSDQKRFARQLLKQNTIIELDGLDVSGKKFLMPLLALWLFHVKLDDPRRESLSFVIFVEEAHHVLYRHEQRARESVMNMLLRQCREIGIAMIVIDQHPHLISSAALGNTYTSICMNLKDPADINRAAGLSMLEEGEKKFLSQLPVGQGIVKMQDRWHKPFLLRFPLVSIRKGIMTDKALEDFLDGRSTLSAPRAPENEDSGSFEPFRVRDIPYSDTVARFLEDIILFPQDGVNARYKRLGYSADKGHRIKRTLLKHNMIEEQRIPVGRTRKVVLGLHPAARNALPALGEHSSNDVLKTNGLKMEPLISKSHRDFKLPKDKEQRIILIQNIIDECPLPSARSNSHPSFSQDPTFRESLAHSWWKRWYAEFFESQDYQIKVEASRRKGRVDIWLKKIIAVSLSK